MLRNNLIFMIKPVKFIRQLKNELANLMGRIINEAVYNNFIKLSYFSKGQIIRPQLKKRHLIATFAEAFSWE